AHEAVVVGAAEQHGVAHVDRGRLAAEPGPALVDVAAMAGFAEAVGGHQPGDARPDDGDPQIRRAGARARSVGPVRTHRPKVRTAPAVPAIPPAPDARSRACGRA